MKIDTIYLAGGLFTLADRLLNAQLAKAFGDLHYEVYNPQDIDVELLAQVGPLDTPSKRDAFAHSIYSRDIQMLLPDNVAVVARMDGEGVDDGTAYEIGRKQQAGGRVVCYLTDMRVDVSQPASGLNFMFYECPVIYLAELVTASSLKSLNAAVEKLVRQIDRELNR